MIKFISPRNSALAFAFAGFAGLAMSSFAGQANASIVDECHGNTKGKVVACCKQHIERYGRPLWMSNGEDNNCRSVVVKCVAKRSNRFCSIQVPREDKSGRPTTQNANVRNPGIKD